MLCPEDILLDNMNRSIYKEDFVSNSRFNFADEVMDRHDSLWSLDLMVSVLSTTWSMRNMATAWKLGRLNWRVMDAACQTLCRCALCTTYFSTVYGWTMERDASAG
jgi:hypothetical protein